MSREDRALRGSMAEVRIQTLLREKNEARAEVERLTKERDDWYMRALKAEDALQGMLMEWDKLTRYGSPMAKAANERVTAARRAVEDKP